MPRCLPSRSYASIRAPSRACFRSAASTVSTPWRRIQIGRPVWSVTSAVPPSGSPTRMAITRPADATACCTVARRAARLPENVRTPRANGGCTRSPPSGSDSHSRRGKPSAADRSRNAPPIIQASQPARVSPREPRPLLRVAASCTSPGRGFAPLSVTGEIVSDPSATGCSRATICFNSARCAALPPRIATRSACGTSTACQPPLCVPSLPVAPVLPHEAARVTAAPAANARMVRAAPACIAV